MNQYDADALMAYFKKHQVSRRTAVIGGAVVVIGGASAAYLALPGTQRDTAPAPTAPAPSAPTAPSAPSRPSAPSAPSRPSPAPAPAPAPSPEPQEGKKRVIVGLSEDMNTLFPLAYPPGGAGPHRTLANMMEMLYYENRDFQSWGGKSFFVGILSNPADNGVGPAPGSKPGDLTRIRIKLRPNVRFHSGAKLTSESLSGPFSSQFVYNDSNWSFYYPVGRMDTEIVDDLTADMVFARTNLSNLTGFTHSGRPFMWNPAWIEERGFGGRGANFGGDDQDGTGPYKLKEWVPGVRIVMEKNRDYWADNLPDAEKQSTWGGAAGNVDEVIFVFIKEPAAQVTAIQAGDIDVIVETDLNSVSSLLREPRVNVFESGPGQIYAVYFNTLYKPLQDIRVRQAMFNVIDPRELRALFDDRNPVARSIFLPWMLGFADGLRAWRPLDIPKAKELMSQSGYKDGFDLQVSPDNRPDNSILGAALGPQISRAGINATVKQYQSTEWNTITSDNDQTELHVYPFSIGFRNESIDLFDFFFRASFRRLRASMEIPELHGTFDPR
ncbi:MAG: ABC transporter substrate-binding protein, partial [Nitrososphaerales archaeon]